MEQWYQKMWVNSPITGSRALQCSELWHLASLRSDTWCLNYDYSLKIGTHTNGAGGNGGFVSWQFFHDTENTLLFNWELIPWNTKGCVCLKQWTWPCFFNDCACPYGRFSVWILMSSPDLAVLWGSLLSTEKNEVLLLLPVLPEVKFFVDISYFLI